MKCILPNLLDLIKGKEGVMWTECSHMKLLTVGIVHDGDNNNYLYFVSPIIIAVIRKSVKTGTTAY